MKVTVESKCTPNPEPKPRTWLEAMRIKQLDAIKYRDVHLKEACASKSFVPDQDYCAVCTSLDRKCPSEFPNCQDWEDSEDISECSDWDADFEEQDRQKREVENKQAKEAEAPLRRPQTLQSHSLFRP